MRSLLLTRLAPVLASESPPWRPPRVRHPAALLDDSTLPRRGKVTDSIVAHDFTFTPALSFFVDCESEEEIARLFSVLSNGGSILMPLNNYGFSQRFGWINDRYGVSWQLNLA